MNLIGIINKMEPNVLDKYPNYVWAYVHHHFSPNIVLGSTALIYFINHPPLREFVKNEGTKKLLEMFERLKR